MNSCNKTAITLCLVIFTSILLFSIDISTRLQQNLFAEDIARTLSRQKKWKELAQLCQQAVQGLYSRSYKLWYYRTCAQCALLRFDRCKESAFEAAYLAEKQDDISSLLNFLRDYVDTKSITSDISLEII